jgi:hypothetical protein
VAGLLMQLLFLCRYTGPSAEPQMVTIWCIYEKFEIFQNKVLHIHNGTAPARPITM